MDSYKPTMFTQMLQVALIVLKLCEVISWSWGWVLAPFWVYLIGVIFLECFGD